MIRANCNQAGIRRVDPFGNLTGTECPHCGDRNGQREALPEDYEEDEIAKCERDAKAEINYGDAQGQRYYCPGKFADVLAMSRLQRARRIAYWRGSLYALIFAAMWMLASAYAERITN